MNKMKFFYGKPWFIFRGILILAYFIVILIKPPKDPFNRWLYITTLIILIISYLFDLTDYTKKDH